jgi:hypothetical protein
MLIANSESSDIAVELKGLKIEKNTKDSIEGRIGEAENRVELKNKAGIMNVK